MIWEKQFHNYHHTTPSSAALLLIPLPRAAVQLMNMQLRMKPVNLIVYVVMPSVVIWAVPKESNS